MRRKESHQVYHSTNPGSPGVNINPFVTNYPINAQNLFQNFRNRNEERRDASNQIHLAMKQEIDSLKLKMFNYEINMMNMMKIFERMDKEKMEIIERTDKEKMEIIERMDKEKMEIIERMDKEKMEIIERMDKEKMENEKKQKKMEIEIQKLRNFDENIAAKINKIEKNVENFGNLVLNFPKDKKLIDDIKLFSQKLQYLIDEFNKLKADIINKNKINDETFLKYEKEIQKLKSQIKELQSLFVGRKIIKILLKIIINNCFEVYGSNGNEITVRKYKDQKYIPYQKISNNLIRVIMEKNKILHINDEINSIIDIINDKSTYGEILNVIKPSIKKNDFDNIRQLLEEKFLFNKICKHEMIGYDEDLNVIISSICK